MPVRDAPASSSDWMAGAVPVAILAWAYQVGLPFETLWPAMANRSLTMKLNPARGPESRPRIGCLTVCGINAPTGSLDGTEITWPHLTLSVGNNIRSAASMPPLDGEAGEARQRCAGWGDTLQACPHPARQVARRPPREGEVWSLWRGKG